MPITQSVKKSLRQSEKNKVRNLKKKKIMKDLIKEAFALTGTEKKEELKTLLPKVYKAIDKAAKQSIIKKNTASRRKSRMARLLNIKSR